MWMIGLYGLATFVETGLGIWMFGKMFPERESSSDCRLARRILLTLLILTTYTMNRAYGKEFAYEKYFFVIVYTVVMILDFVLCRYRNFFIVDEKIKKVILFTYVSLMLTWQYWVSYVSFGIILLANLYLPFFLFLFYECDMAQAYLWEVLYLVNMGFAKILYIYIAGMIRHRKVDDFLFSKSMHFYIGGIYILAICILFWLLQRAFRIEIWMGELLKNHKRLILLVAMSECSVLYLLMSMNWGYIENRDLVIGFIVISCIVLILLFFFIYFFTKSMNAEKNILEVRNNIVASQYEELNENYKKYRCLIHDEKHMMNYIEECIRTGNLSEIQNMIKKNRSKFSERYYWTGIIALDNVIAIEKRKMDNINIKFYIETNITDIVMEDIDLIVLLENLFDNAIEAVEKCGEDRKEIRFNIKNVNSMLILKLWNCSCKEPNIKKERFITDKNDSKGHGWGLESVKYIVKKYNGNIEFKYGETFFEVIIIQAEFELKECIVRLNGEVVNSEEYTGEVIRGFRMAYAEILQNQDLKRMMESFFDGKSRVILRHTQQYYMYLFASFHPGYMKDRKQREELLQVLHKKRETPLQKELRDYEIESLLELDIPYFEIDGHSRSFFDGNGKEYPGYLPYTPYEAWMEHMKQLSYYDMEQQCDYIRLSMGMLNHGYIGEKRSEENISPNSYVDKIQRTEKMQINCRK